MRAGTLLPLSLRKSSMVPGILVLALGFTPQGGLRSPMRSSAVSMGPIRAIKRLIGIQKQNFLEANVSASTS